MAGLSSIVQTLGSRLGPSWGSLPWSLGSRARRLWPSMGGVRSPLVHLLVAVGPLR
jgi:hypothetical protein